MIKLKKTGVYKYPRFNKNRVKCICLSESIRLQFSKSRIIAKPSGF